MINKEEIEKIIDDLKLQISNHKIHASNLEKFTKSKADQEFLSYVNGHGGGYIKFLSLLVKKFDFKNIVELGNREGLSTLAIYDGMPSDSHFITIDIEKDQRYCPDAMFNDRRIKFIFGDVSNLSIFKNNIPMDIDFLFTDTIHHDFQLRDEWNIYQNLLADKALVAIDDININDKRKLFDEIDYLKWDLTNICHDSGWGLFLFERKAPLTREEKILSAYQASASIWYRKYNEVNNILDKHNSKKLIFKIKKFVHKYPIIHQISLFLRFKK